MYRMGGGYIQISILKSQCYFYKNIFLRWQNFIKFLFVFFFVFQLTKLRLALDSETAMHSNLAASVRNGNNDNSSTQATTNATGGGDNASIQYGNKSNILGKSEERIQALSVIMLYLCTGLQHAQGVAMH